jgi:hypothetical protein
MNSGFSRRSGRSVAGRGLVLLAALVLCAPLAALNPDEPVQAGAPGQIIDLPGGPGAGELLSFDPTLAPALLALKADEGREVTGFPTAPGVRRRVHLVRTEIYAPDAHIYRVEGTTRTEVPRSRLVFFSGADVEGLGNRLWVALDPDTREYSGFVQGPDGVHEISRGDRRSSRRQLLIAPPAVPDGATWTCGQEDTVETSVSWAPSGEARSAAAGRRANVLTSPYKAVVAIDTDNEYMAYWGNNTTNATNYIASLIANINVMYQRDLNLKLVQGTTFLRVSTTPDPYTVNDGSNADGSELNEFTNYWNANYPLPSYPRSVVTMMSGKQPGTNSASGIAWVAGSVCGNSVDYNFCQLFKMSYLWGDTLIMGHEIGHNLGSPHTHCYADPAPDRCYNQESCYSGPTSCPATQTINGVTNVQGTLMGYCHLLSGCSSSLVFHPSTISRYVGPTLDTGATSACIALVTSVSPPPPVSAATSLSVVTPCRILDTRNASGPLGGPSIGAGGLRSFVATGACNVPAGAVAISANVTVVNPAAAGDLVVYPNGLASPPTASTISFRAGQTRANNTLIYLASDGSFLVKNNAAGTLDLVLDVNGYFK